MSFQKKSVSNRSFNTEQSLALLQEFKDAVSLGFTDETWTRASWALRDMSRIQTPDVVCKLGDLLAEQFAFPSLQRVESVVVEVHGMILSAK